MHYVDGQCVYVYKIQFDRCKPCDGQNRGRRCYKPMEPPGSRDTRFGRLREAKYAAMFIMGFLAFSNL